MSAPALQPTPAERVDDKHREIDLRIRTMTVIVFVLVGVAFLILSCCIVSWVLLHVDIQKDRATEVFVPIVTLAAPNTTTGSPTGDPVCEDGNSCTLDLERVLGGCEYWRLPTGIECGSLCYDDTVEPLYCGIEEVQKGVDVPKCLGTHTQCRGYCTADADCPPIQYDLGEGSGTAFMNVLCQGHACHYSYDHPPGPYINYYNRYPFNCTDENSDKLEIWKASCRSLVVDESRNLIDSCMVSDVSCRRADAIANPGIEFSPDGNTVGEFIYVPRCHYYFWCSKPCLGNQQESLSVRLGGDFVFESKKPPTTESLRGPTLNGVHGTTKLPPIVTTSSKGLNGVRTPPIGAPVPPGIRLPPKSVP